ncbi:myo-inosose-2 dehydratase [Rapidithrix thailandica]|uniref:Myo-inosose-2 dehydratase n=1 Tax=Rapidithrix thailandica TaxID=413964 RepID=A0AAW9RTE6_9BACT
MFDESKVFFGITPTGWTNDDNPLIGADISFEQCVSEMALAGFVGCSVGHKYPTDIQELQSALNLRGLRVSEPWASLFFTMNEMYDQTITYFNRQLDFIKTMGGTDLVVAELGHAVHQQSVAVLPNSPTFTEDQWQSLITGLNEIGEIAYNQNMKVCYHPHVGTGVERKPEIDRLMESVDPNLVHLLLDTGHLYYAGENPLEITELYADRIKHCHLKDIRQEVLDSSIQRGLSFLQSVEEGVFTVPGDGVIDFQPIFQVLSDHGYEGWLVVEAEQDPEKATPLLYAQMARTYLKEVTGI